MWVTLGRGDLLTMFSFALCLLNSWDYVFIVYVILQPPPSVFTIYTNLKTFNFIMSVCDITISQEVTSLLFPIS